MEWALDLGVTCVKVTDTETRVSEIEGRCLPGLLEAGVATWCGSVFGRRFGKMSKTSVSPVRLIRHMCKDDHIA